MQPGPPLPEPASSAPVVAVRLGIILRALAGLVARAFLRDPRHVALIIPLHGYITRTIRRFEAALARTAPYPPRPPRPRTARQSITRISVLPRRRGWLVETLRHEAAGYGSQLAYLLNEPETARLLAAAPHAARVLRPICHLLGIRPAALQPPTAAPSHAPAPRPARARPRPQRPEPYTLPAIRTGPPCPHITWWPWFPAPSS